MVSSIYFHFPKVLETVNHVSYTLQRYGIHPKRTRSYLTDCTYQIKVSSRNSSSVTAAVSQGSLICLISYVICGDDIACAPSPIADDSNLSASRNDWQYLQKSLDVARACSDNWDLLLNKNEFAHLNVGPTFSTLLPLVINKISSIAEFLK